MAVDIIITLTAISVDQGTLFNLYSNVDGFNIPYEEDVTSTSLLNGYTTSAPDNTTTVRVCGETPQCLDCLDIIPEYTTTTTTTIPPQSLACSETTNSGGYGVTEYVIALDSAGGVVIADFNAQSVPDKLEILHNGIKVATSGMDLIDNGGIAGFDNLYGDPTIPESWQAADSEWFIGSSKGVVPNREAEFATDTGINGITSNRQQLIWFKYDNADWTADQNAIIRVTGPTGTAWNLDIQCLPTYISLTADVSVINEGQSATFTVVSENIPDGTTVGWTIAGDLSADIVGGAITGTFTMIGNTDSVVITTIEDFLTEGPEAMTMQLDNPDSIGTVVPALFDTVIITDTSINTTTTTTTLATVACGASSVSGGVGVTEFIFDLNPTGSTLILDFDPQGVPDKLEIIHNGVKKATSGFAPVVNAGPFDNLYGDPTVPTVNETLVVDQFIGTNKAVAPTRDAEFLADTGITGITANNQQLVWWTYDATDYGNATTAIARITGPTGTGWNLDRICQPEVALGDVLFNTSDNPTDIYQYDPATTTETFLFNPGVASSDIAHTENKLWVYNGVATELLEYDITLNPFTSVSSRTITGVSANSGLCAIDDVTLVNVNGLNVYSLDITNPAAVQSLQFNMGISGRTVSGDYVYTTGAKLIMATQFNTQTYITQFDWATGTLEFDLEITATVPSPYGVYQYNSQIYVVNVDGSIYSMLTSSPYTLTLVDNLTITVNGASQVPSQITEQFDVNITTTTTTTTV